MSILSLLLAQQDVETREDMIRRLGRGFRSEIASNELVVYLIAVLVLLVVLLLVREYLTGHKRSARKRRDFFRDAVRILGLRGREREDILQLAARARLPEPVAMLLSPANLAHAYARAYPRASDTDLRRRLDALSRKLFSRPLPEQSLPPPPAT